MTGKQPDAIAALRSLARYPLGSWGGQAACEAMTYKPRRSEGMALTRIVLSRMPPGRSKPERAS